MKQFVDQDSIVRKIWGKGDTILFIFAGASAEFALNKAVDWLYFTGKLPADPLGRLFSTVTYARRIVFSEYDAALQAIDQITAIHQTVESTRGFKIPDWAYRDVLFMLIDYSIRSYEVLGRTLTEAEKQQVFEVFSRVGTRMHIPGLPDTYAAWVPVRQQHLQDNLIKSNFTADLFMQYSKHLGYIRYTLLKQVQVLIAPLMVRQLLGFNRTAWLRPFLWFYKISRYVKIDTALRYLILPNTYKTEIRNLDK
jgi:uncharacterized protein (DUF2236 family)